MVDNQDTNSMLVCKLFQFSNHLIIAGIAVIVAYHLPDFLQGIHDNQFGVTVLPDIDSYVGLMHTLFTLEDNYGLKISEMDGEVCLKVDVRKNKGAARLHEMLCSWQQAASMLEAGEISKEDYDKWRYKYPEFDKAHNYVKVPPQDLF